MADHNFKSRDGGFFGFSCSANLRTLLDELGNEGCHATRNLIPISWDMWHLFLPDQTAFGFPTSIFNHFHNKIGSAQRNTHSMQMLCTVPPNNCFLEGNFHLCVEKVVPVLEPFFLHTKT